MYTSRRRVMLLCCNTLRIHKSCTAGTRRVRWLHDRNHRSAAARISRVSANDETRLSRRVCARVWRRRTARDERLSPPSSAVVSEWVHACVCVGVSRLWSVRKFCSDGDDDDDDDRRPEVRAHARPPRLARRRSSFSVFSRPISDPGADPPPLTLPGKRPSRVPFNCRRQCVLQKTHLPLN